VRGTKSLLEGVGSRLRQRIGTAGIRTKTHGVTTDKGRAGDGETDGRTGVRPENMVWIFGSGRTGSTWVADMIGEMKGQSVWFEPRVGYLFEPLRFKGVGGNQFILSPSYKDTWLKSVRNFVLDGANVRFPEVTGPNDYLMIKEPAGSAGASCLMQALPESRLVLLIRDPRDVAASWLDAAGEGGWHNERKKATRRGKTLAEKNPNAFIRRVSKTYLRNVGGAKEAYEAHKGPKTLVRYEDLRADTLGTMRRMYSELGIPVDEEELSRAVHKHSWEMIPEEKKGEGKFYRKGKPGSWREDLTPRQIEIVEKETAQVLKAFYSA
jgi:hypothetical protein